MKNRSSPVNRGESATSAIQDLRQHSDCVTTRNSFQAAAAHNDENRDSFFAGSAIQEQLEARGQHLQREERVHM